MADKLVAGIDVQGLAGPLHFGRAGVERITNTREAVAAWLERVGPGLIAFEPTGGWERILIAAARERGIPFVRVHPNDVIALRKSRGIKAKTDAIDARLILAFACDRLVRSGWRTSLIGDDRLCARSTAMTASRLARTAGSAAVPRRQPSARRLPNWPGCCRPSLASVRWWR